jgi:hypothetical protein
MLVLGAFLPHSFGVFIILGCSLPYSFRVLDSKVGKRYALIAEILRQAVL